jgi:LysR family transcriptional regulator, transcriptional activator of nhaA
MEWLNYHHLFYFWRTARCGSIAKAAEELRLSPPTLSAQVRQLEAALGEPLFSREGRRMLLTDVGRVVLGYAEEIFMRGREMVDTVKGRSAAPTRLVVGISDFLPKLVAWRLLQPALAGTGVRVVCRENSHDRLLAALAVHELDVVLSDSPASSALGVRAHNHPLGECGLSFFAAPALAKTLRGKPPKCLDGAPMLMPTDVAVLRHSLDGWFIRHDIHPRVVGEFDDRALLMTFGQAGAGVFAAPSVIETEVIKQHRVRVLGRTSEIRERYFAISADRRLRHPAVAALTTAARHAMFGEVAGATLPTV